MNRRDEGLEYLKQYPKLNKWINRCICCGAIGYSSDLPEQLTSSDKQGEFITVGAQNLRYYFRPLDVNEIGVCETCQKFVNF